MANDFKNLTKDTDEVKMYKAIIKIYTMDYYKKINNAVQKDFGIKTKPSADDIALALYDLMLDAVLYSWKELKPVKDKTYRGIPGKLSSADMKLFEIGTRPLKFHQMSYCLLF